MTLKEKLARLKGVLSDHGYKGSWTRDAIAKAIENDDELGALRFEIEQGKSVNATKAYDLLIRGLEAEAVEMQEVGGDEPAEDPADPEGADAGEKSLDPAKVEQYRRAKATDAAARINAKQFGAKAPAVHGPTAAKAKHYNSRAKQGREFAGAKLTAFDSADKAEAFGAYTRLGWAAGKHYNQKSNDLAILSNFFGSALDVKALGSGTLGSGGDFSIDEWIPDLADVREQFSVARRLVNFRSVQREAGSMPKAGADVSVYAAGQNPSSLTESNPGTDSVNFALVDFFGYSKASNSWIDDAAIDAGEYVAFSHARGHGVKEQDTLINGDGSGTYGGIVGIDDSLLAGSKISASGNSWAAITWADILKPQGAVTQLAGAADNKYACTRQFFAQVAMPLAQAAGENLRLSTQIAPDGQSAQLAGYEWVFIPSMAKSSGSAVLSLLFGDFNAAILAVEKGGVQIDSDASYLFGTDQIAFRSKNRFDLRVHDVGTATTAGSLVGLYTT